MNVAVIEPGNLSHRTRGIGFYTENLLNSFHKYFPQENIELFSKAPSDTDLIHYPFFEPFFLSLPIFKSKKTVVTVHDLIPLVFPNEFPAGIRGKAKWTIQKRVLKMTDGIITDSENSKKDILKVTGVNEKKIKVIYLAADPEFRKVPIKELKQKKDILKNKYNIPEKFALYVGDVTWNKNLPRLIEAVREINISLVMVGSALSNRNYDRTNPWNKGLVKVQEMLKGDKRIIVTGFVEKAELVALYNLASLFVMPSLYEGFGLPVLEAMSCGCPVITTKRGSLGEISGEAAYFCDPYDINDMANALGELYFNTGTAKKFSRRGVEQAKNFSWRKTAEETLEFYRETIKGG